MQHRIRAGAIVIDKGKMLLVKHSNEENYEWWTVPGGGVEGEESVFDCVIREVLEEVNLRATPGKIVAVRQYISDDHGVNQIEFFIRCAVQTTNVNLDNLKGKNDEHSLVQAGWVDIAQLADYNIFPRSLKTIDLSGERIQFIGPERDYE